MGAKAKKALKAKLKKVTSASKVSEKKEIAAAAAADFLPLAGGRGRKIPEEKPLESTAKPTVLYIGRIPHGFYESEMEAYFSQFGKIKRFRVARNRKTGKSKHYGFMEFEDPEVEVAEIVADCMHNYLLFEHLLQVHLIPQEKVHPKMWRGYYKYKPVDRVKIQRKRQSKERTLEDHNKLVQKIKKQSQKRQRSITAAGIDYDCPDIVGEVLHAPKKIKFSED